MAVIEVEKIRFAYGQRPVLQDVSFRVARGRTFGLLGPNGGGKTTLFRILCTLLLPQGGQVRISGLDVVRQASGIRRLLGVVFQSNSLDVQLTCLENLLLQGRLYGLSGAGLRRAAEDKLLQFGLGARRDEKVAHLSGGLRRRLELAKSLLHRPSILVLDEPTQGLDPGIQYELWNYLQVLREEERITIVLTTHLMEEAERCDELAILDEGKVVAAGTPQSLREAIGGDIIIVRTEDPEEIRRKIEDRFSTRGVVVNGTVRLERPRGHEFIPQLVESFPGQIQAVTVGKPTLEDVFIHKTGKRFWNGERL